MSIELTLAVFCKSAASKRPFDDAADVVVDKHESKIVTARTSQVVVDKRMAPLPCPVVVVVVVIDIMAVRGCFQFEKRPVRTRTAE